MAQSFRTRWRLPLEHGAWGMLYIPLILGFLSGRLWTWRIAALFLAATGCFLARGPMLAWARAARWKKAVGDAPQFTALYLGIGGLAGLALLWPADRWALAGFAAVAAVILGVNTWQGVSREDRTVVGELTAIAGMTLTAPAAFYTATGRLDPSTAILWVECMLFFASSVVYVKARVAMAHEKVAGQAEWLRLVCAAYHTFLMALLATLVSNDLIGRNVALGFAPVVIRAMWFVARPQGKLNLKRIGWIEVLCSVVFLAAAGGLY